MEWAAVWAIGQQRLLGPSMGHASKWQSTLRPTVICLPKKGSRKLSRTSNMRTAFTVMSMAPSGLVTLSDCDGTFHL